MTFAGELLSLLLEGGSQVGVGQLGQKSSKMRADDMAGIVLEGDGRGA